MTKDLLKPVVSEIEYNNHSYEVYIYKTHTNAIIFCDNNWVGSCLFRTGKLEIEDYSIFNSSEEDCERLILALEADLIVKCELLDIQFHLLGVPVSNISKQIYLDACTMQ